MGNFFDAPVPFVSQLGNKPNNDCGIACALMLAEWMGRRNPDDTVERWAARVDPEDNGTLAGELVWVLRQFGIWAVVTDKPSGCPYIALVDYVSLPVGNRLDKSGRTFGHWIVRLSGGSYHDPYLPAGYGGQKADPAVLDAAERNGVAKYAGGMPTHVELVKQSMARESARVAYERVVNVIPSWASEEEATRIFLKAWRAGKQTVTGSYDDAGIGDGLAHKAAVLHGIGEGARGEYVAFYGKWYPTTEVVFVN